MDAKYHQEHLKSLASVLAELRAFRAAHPAPKPLEPSAKWLKQHKRKVKV